MAIKRNSAYSTIPFIYNSRKGKLMYRNRKQISGCLGEGRKGGAGRRDDKGTG